MPDDLDAFLAQQDAADTADVERHLNIRREAKEAIRHRKALVRDKAAILADLESGTDELSAMDKAIAAKDNAPR